MTTKITVSLPDDVVAHARRAVAEGRAPSVSAYVAEALSRMRRDSSADDFVAFLVEQHGEPSAEAYDWADRVLGLK
jgi:antitoxin ParD1/3/4